MYTHDPELNKKNEGMNKSTYNNTNNAKVYFNSAGH